MNQGSGPEGVHVRPRASWLLLLVLALAAGPALGQWREDGKVVPDNDWRKSAGSFGAMMMLTEDPEKFFEQWNKPPSPDYKPKITTTEELRRGGHVAALVLFIGCQADSSGNCSVEADYLLRSPDGGVYGEQKNVKVWKDKPAPPDMTMQLGVSVFGLEVEEGDPLGTYMFEAKVRDRNAKVEVLLKRPLKVAK